MEQSQLSLTEYAVLGLLAEGRSHGFALAKQLGPDGDAGRVLTVRRPLVYRALDRLVVAGLAEPVHTEKGDAGPQRVIHRVTRRGRQRLRRWLEEPVEHIRDIRIEFQLKLTLLERSGVSPMALIKEQKATLNPTLTALDDPETRPIDHVNMWRKHNAAAAAAYLDDLEALYRRT
jgi:DNA-binding PadR family transcriptional regulator